MAFGHLYVWLVSVQPPNPTTGCRDNILSGAAKGTSNRLTFLTASDRAQSVELFIQVLWGKVAIFTGETNPPDELWLFIPVSEYSSNDLGL